MINVKVKKFSIPSFWLDTSIIIKMAIWKSGLQLNQADKKRISQLYDKLKKLTEQLKMFCPLGDQQEEIWKGEEVCHEIATSLSLGINLLYKEAIQFSQLNALMQAYLNGKTEVELEYQDAFGENLDEEFKQLRYKKFIVSVLPMKYQSIDEIKKKRSDLREKLQNLKDNIKSQSISYNEQLRKEYDSSLEAYSLILNKSINLTMQGLPLTLTEYEGINSIIELWNRYKGEPPDIEGVISFLKSDYFKKIPLINIQCKLGTFLLTDNSILEDGDSMDISHISTTLPYCTAILVDDKMKNRIHNLNLHEEYDTHVFSLRDFDSIMNFLEGIDGG